MIIAKKLRVSIDAAIASAISAIASVISEWKSISHTEGFSRRNNTFWLHYFTSNETSGALKSALGPHLFDKPLAEGGAYPLPGVDPAVDPHRLLLRATPLP